MTEDKASSWLLERVGQEGTIRLPEGHSIVGRLPQCSIRICSRFCSRRHCKFSVCSERITVSDFSSNGVFVNGEQFIGKEVELCNNDRIGIGVEATDEECARDMEYFIFILRKAPQTIVVINSECSREKNKSGDASEADTNDCCKIQVERESIAEVSALIGCKYEDELNSEKRPLSRTKNAKVRVSMDKENMNLIDLLGESTPFKAAPLRENTKQSDEEISSNHIYLISDEEEEADNVVVHNKQCKTSNSLHRVNINVNKNENAGRTENDKTSEDLKNGNNNTKSTSEPRDSMFLQDHNTDEESEMLLSQSLIRDIKQEIVDLEMSFISDERHNEPSNNIVNNIYIEREKEDMSPLIELDDDDDENILQSDNNLETDWDNIYQDKCKEEAPRKPKLAEKRKMLEIIDPPTLPEKRGKLRGISAEIITPKIKVEIIPRRKETFKKRDKPVSREQWLQKPTLQKRSRNEQVKKLQDERKQKLKELAKEQADKRKPDDGDSVKIVNKPKVKVTMKNRGAFLAEEGLKQSIAMPSDDYEMQAQKLRFKEFSADSSFVKKEKTEECCQILEKSNVHDANKANEILCSELKKRNVQSLIKVDEVALNDIQQQSKNIRKHKMDCGKMITSQHVTSFKSIIKKSDSSKSQKNVRFCDNIKIVYIPLEKCSGRKLDRADVPMHFLTRGHTENILSAILAWDPAWLETRKEEVNGRNHLLLPMLHKFPTFDDFRRILIPLMKLELWAQIEQITKTQKGSSIPLRVESYRIEKRGDLNRSVCNCNYVPSNLKSGFPFNISDLCVVTAESSRKPLKVFGYIENFKKIGSAQHCYYQVMIQTVVSAEFKELIDITKRITIKPITQLRVDLGAFSAIHHLKYSSLLESILDPTNLLHSKTPSIENIRYKGYEEMNDDQKGVLLKTYLKSANLDESNICLIEGPPGTGKSRLISNLVLQLLYGDETRNFEKKILICSQSNAAIDVITSKLLKIRAKMVHSKFRLVRFGILERMSPAVRGVSVQSLIERQLVPSENLDALKKERELLEITIRQLNEKIESGTNSVQYDELQKLKQKLDIVNRLPYQQNLIQRRKNMYRRQLQGAHIVCTTLSSCIHMLQYTNNFDICIVDEATLCLEPWTLIPLQFDISSLVLVGDTQQLPATVLSKVSADYGLTQSLFTRIQKCLSSGDSIFHLRTQYRMHPEICKWPNSYFYNNTLISDKSTLVRLPIKPYSIFNIDFSKNEDCASGNIINYCEADFVTELLVHLTKLLPTAKYTYGVITPYAQQRDIISKKLRTVGINDIPVNTIDSCQGKEKDVIIISNTRTKGVGFLGNSQRLNVALTRAKKCLILCGRFSCLEEIHVWKSLLDDARKRQLFHNISKHHLEDFEKYVMTKLLC